MTARPAFAAGYKPVPSEGSTHQERFTDAVRILCGGAVPPQEFVTEWISNIEVNGEHRLQGWVLSQPGSIPWAQGIAILDAATVLANGPEEGCGHEVLTSSSRGVMPQTPSL